jgi:hypothetical protein
MKKQILLLALFLVSQLVAFSQDPFEKYGYKPRIHTLSDGKYQEFFDNEDVVRIGTALYNTQTQKIVGYVEEDSTKYQQLEAELASRWMSLDPMAEEYPRWSPYNYAGDDPINKFDPNGMWIESVLDVGFILYDLGEMAYDYATKGKVNSVSVAALSADVACLALPIATGGGLAVRAAKEGGEQVAKQVTKEVAKETTEKVAKETTESKGARFVGDTDGKLIDTKSTSKGSYTQPDGSRTDVLQDKSHYNKSTKENHGTTHTHETYKNVDNKGNTRTGVDQRKTHVPTYKEVKNIENGNAKRN